ARGAPGPTEELAAQRSLGAAGRRKFLLVSRAARPCAAIEELAAQRSLGAAGRRKFLLVSRAAPAPVRLLRNLPHDGATAVGEQGAARERRVNGPAPDPFGFSDPHSATHRFWPSPSPAPRSAVGEGFLDRG